MRFSCSSSSADICARTLLSSSMPAISIWASTGTSGISISLKSLVCPFSSISAARMGWSRVVMSTSAEA
jgi:hypothetical protein